MTPEQLGDYRTKLVGLAASLDRGLAHDRHELLRDDEPGVPYPSAENRMDSGAQEVEIGVIANEEHLLAEVTAALGRIDAGTFGQCETCGRRIAKARLVTLPYARLCIRCARVRQPVPG